MRGDSGSTRLVRLSCTKPVFRTLVTHLALSESMPERAAMRFCSDPGAHLLTRDGPLLVGRRSRLQKEQDVIVVMRPLVSRTLFRFLGTSVCSVFVELVRVQFSRMVLVLVGQIREVHLLRGVCEVGGSSARTGRRRISQKSQPGLPRRASRQPTLNGCACATPR